MKSFKPCVIGLAVSAILTVYVPLRALPSGSPTCEKTPPSISRQGGSQSFAALSAAWIETYPCPDRTKSKIASCWLGVNLNSSSRRSAVDDDHVVLADGRGFQDGGVLADRHLEPAGVLERAGQVQCLVAVTMMLALAAREQEDLGAVRHFLLGEGRLRRTARQDQDQDR